MKSKILAFICVLSVVLSLSAAETAALKVTVAGIKEIKGYLMIAVYDSEDAFNNDGKPIREEKVKVESSTVELSYDGLESGDYAIMVYHDKNDNGKLDSLIIPLEPVGVSNNPKLRGQPKFKQASFPVKEGNNSIAIELMSF